MKAPYRIILHASLLIVSLLPADAFNNQPPCDPSRDPNCQTTASNWRHWNYENTAFVPSSKYSTAVGARISGPSSPPSKDSDDKALNLSAEEEYKIKLAEAERAIAEAEVARKKLLTKNGSNGIGVDGMKAFAPASSRSVITYSDAGTLVVDIPPTGINAAAVLPGVFSLVWFSAILPATFAGGIGSALFLIPFWVSGGMVAKLAFYDPFLGGELSIGKYAWSLRSTYAGFKKKDRDGATAELKGAAAEVAVWVNDVPKGELRLYGEKGMVSLGLGLAFEELEYLAGVINQHISDLRESSDEDPLYEGVL